MSTLSTAKYPLSVKLFHSLIALLMIATLVVGWQLDDNGDLTGLHKSLGVSVFLLALLRIINRIRTKNRVPRSVNAVGSLQYFAEKIVHGLLYVVMLVLPLFGWLTSNAFGYPASFFGLFNLPTLIAKDPSFGHTLKHLHGFTANVFIGLVCLHVLGAIVHLIINKENVFKRMS